MRLLRAPTVIIEFILLLSIGQAHVAWAQTAPPAPAGGGPANSASPIGLADIAQHPYLITLIALLIFSVLAVLLYNSAQNPDDQYILKLSASFFFWLGLGYALLLLLLAIVYNASYHDEKQPYLIAGILPIGVPWFGAVGAVTISLEGIFKWNQQWNPGYNYWHIGRPLFGAVLGIVAFYLFVLIFKSAGSTLPFLTDQTAHPSAPTDFIIFYVLAFLVGYREETFRELIRRATDLILKPAAAQDSDAPQLTFRIAGVIVTQIEFAKATPGTESRRTVEILNTGKAPLVAPNVTITTSDPSSNGVFKLDKDNVTGVKELGPNLSGTVDVTFIPANAGQYSAFLNVAGTNLAPPAAIHILGAA